MEQILLFSKQIEKERKPLRLQLIVQEAVKLLRPSISAIISIQQRIDSSCDPVLADASQIHQVIVNLCTNAWHAMEEKVGILTIELERVKVDATTLRLHPNLNEGEYNRLSVIDTGKGMDEATLDRIFDPFFTTKSVIRERDWDFQWFTVLQTVIRATFLLPVNGKRFHISCVSANPKN